MIIVIGATGFIGTYLIDQLVKEGVDVLAWQVRNIIKI